MILHIGRYSFQRKHEKIPWDDEIERLFSIHKGPNLPLDRDLL